MEVSLIYAATMGRSRRSGSMLEQIVLLTVYSSAGTRLLSLSEQRMPFSCREMRDAEHWTSGN